MDTTADVLLVEPGFGPSEEQITPDVPLAYTGKGNPTLVAKIRVANNKDVENLPPIYISEPEDYSAFQERKVEIGKYPRSQFEAARDKANPFENLGRSIFMNRASIKLANIDAAFRFGLTYHIGAYMHYSTPGPFKFCDIGGSPGGFVQYIQWRRNDAMGYGISLKSTKPGVPEWNFRQIDQSRFFPYYGESNTGNIILEWKNFVNRVRSDQTLGVDLVTADAAFDIESEKAFVRQEFLMNRLIMLQILMGVKLLKLGGNFVIKVFDTVTELTAQLLWITSLCFDKITLFKPISSRPANTEKYLICEGKKKGTERYELLLEQANAAYNEEENVINLLETKIPNDFQNWLIGVNDKLMRGQSQAIERTFEILEGKNPEIPEYNLSKALIIFNLPGNPITRRSKIQVPGSGRGKPILG